MSETRKRSEWSDGPPRIDSDTVDLSKPHMVGMQGELMAPLTQLLVLAGAVCTGTDARMGEELNRMIRTTILKITQGGYRTSCAVYSSAIPEDHPDLLTARATDIPLVHRAQALDMLMRGRAEGLLEHIRHSIGVSGSHGKTLTTAMTGWILRHAGARPVCLLGGLWADTGTGVHADYGDTFVAEIDESDRSHLLTAPDTIVLPSLGHTHPETYTGPEDVRATMLRWITSLPEETRVILPVDDDGTAALAAELRVLPRPPRMITYGTGPQADIPITDLRTSRTSVHATMHLPDRVLKIEVPGWGAHTALNATAAVLAARLHGIDPRRAAEALAVFPGVRRRLQHIGTTRGVHVIDSYASHPTEIIADLTAARALVGDRHKVLVVFQPSGLERLLAFHAQIARALADEADQTLLLPLHTRYPDPTPDRAAHAHTRLHRLLAATGHPVRLSDGHHPTDARAIAAAARPGDVVLTMGTGNVTDFGPRILRALRAQIPVPRRTQPRRRSRSMRRKN